MPCIVRAACTYLYKSALAVLLLILMTCCPAALSTRLPGDIKESLLKEFPDSKIRLDGALQTTKHGLFLPVLPSGHNKGRRGKAQLETIFPAPDRPEMLVFSNGWCFLKVLERDRKRTVLLPVRLPENLRQILLSGKFANDLIVPEQFVLARSLRSLIAEDTIELMEDSELADLEKAYQPRAAARQGHSTRGAVFITSLTAGTVTLLDEKTLKKLAEFPTEGTPCSMCALDGRLYITDQAKNRILILDVERREFLGQIDLPAKSAPKGITALPNGRLLYVSESGLGNIAVVEASTHKVLLKTKVPPGPAHIAITPNGAYLLVLNVMSSQVSFISTSNQGLAGTVRVGAMPSGLAISPDSETAYVSSRQANNITVINIPNRQIIATVNTGVGPTGLCLSRDGSKLLVANARENSITVYDTKTRQLLKEARLPIEVEFPSSLCLLPDGKHLLISSEASDSIAVMNINSYEFISHPMIGHSSHDIIWAPVR